MQKEKIKKLVIHEDDHHVLMELLKSGDHHHAYDSKNADDLRHELSVATIIREGDFPADVVRLNSKVLVREEKTKKLLEFIVVTPRKADLREKRISILAPIGTALLGFKKGDRVKWTMPSGDKYFIILDVQNHASGGLPPAGGLRRMGGE